MQRLNEVLGYSTGSCIFRASLAMFLGLDLCWGGCRATSAVAKVLMKPMREGPACLSWPGRANVVLLSELGLMLSSSSHPQPCIPPPPPLVVPSLTGAKWSESIPNENG